MKTPRCNTQDRAATARQTLGNASSIFFKCSRAFQMLDRSAGVKGYIASFRASCFTLTKKSHLTRQTNARKTTDSFYIICRQASGIRPHRQGEPSDSIQAIRCHACRVDAVSSRGVPLNAVVLINRWPEAQRGTLEHFFTRRLIL